MTGHSTCLPACQPPTDLSAHINKMGDINWPLQTAWFNDEGLTIANAIQTGTAIGVSDGSYKPNTAYDLAAAAWIVVDLRTKQQMGGVVRVPGTAKETNAYRAELHGL